MKKTILSLFVLSALTTQHAFADSSRLCQQQDHAPLIFSQTVEDRQSSEFSLITWNAHKLADPQFLPDLVELSHGADLILIQEAMHSDSLQNQLSRSFNFNFSFYKSFCNSDNQATGVMTASRYTLQNTQTLVSPDTEPILFTHKVSGYAQINVPGIGLVHVINTHALNFNIGFKFERQIDQVASFISHLQGPVIWAGDFNTWIGFRKSYLNDKATKLGLQHLMPQNDSRNLKLDHIYVRGLRAVQVKLLDQYHSSDHKPIEVVFQKN